LYDNIVKRYTNVEFDKMSMIVGGINKRALSKDYKAIEGEVDRVMGYFKERR